MCNCILHLSECPRRTKAHFVEHPQAKFHKNLGKGPWRNTFPTLHARVLWNAGEIGDAFCSEQFLSKLEVGYSYMWDGIPMALKTRNLIEWILRRKWHPENPTWKFATDERESQLLSRRHVFCVKSTTECDWSIELYQVHGWRLT